MGGSLKGFYIFNVSVSAVHLNFTSHQFTSLIISNGNGVTVKDTLHEKEEYVTHFNFSFQKRYHVRVTSHPSPFFQKKVNRSPEAMP